MPVPPVLPPTPTVPQPPRREGVQEIQPVDLRQPPIPRREPPRPVVWISPTGDGLALAFRLKQEGHNVLVWVKDKPSGVLFRGLLRHVDELGEALAAVRPSTLLVFDGVGGGRTADRFRRQQVRVIGGSRLADRLELDREFGLEVMRRAGILVPETVEFTSFEQAREFVRKSDKRWVFKPVRGNVESDFTFVSSDGQQMLDMLTFFERDIQRQKKFRFLLQEFVEGVEISTEGWFDGQRWLMPFNHTMEEKRLAAGGLGPNTGSMGSVVWAVRGGVDRIVESTLLKLTPILGGHAYVGPLDVNCVVNRSGVWGLEFTPRFGYDAIFALTELFQSPLGATLQDITDGRAPELPIDSQSVAYAVRLVYGRDAESDKFPSGLPIHGLTRDLLRHVWFGDVVLDDADRPVTAGTNGCVLTVTARAPSIAQATALVYDRLARIRVPQAYYRVDIGSRVERDKRELGAWLEPVSPDHFQASTAQSRELKTPSGRPNLES